MYYRHYIRVRRQIVNLKLASHSCKAYTGFVDGAMAGIWNDKRCTWIWQCSGYIPVHIVEKIDCCEDCQGETSPWLPPWFPFRIAAAASCFSLLAGSRRDSLLQGGLHWLLPRLLLVSNV